MHKIYQASGKPLQSRAGREATGQKKKSISRVGVGSISFPLGWKRSDVINRPGEWFGLLEGQYHAEKVPSLPLTGQHLAASLVT